MRREFLFLMIFLASSAMADSNLNLDSAPESTLSFSDQRQIQESVQACWDVASLSRRSFGHAIVIQFDLTMAGQVGSKATIVSATSSSAEVVDDLFRAACEAILCAQASGGFNLPVESYAQWEILELVFDPKLDANHTPVLPDGQMDQSLRNDARECRPVGNS